jgi:membrane protein implicated in regulation of membrane protease activity
METVFLACFAFGLLFTLASLVLGAVGGGHFGHVGHAGHGGHVGHLGHAGHADPGSHGAHHAASKGETPLFNASSVVAGLTWFGAAGYVLLRLGDWALPGALLGALAVGALGWYLVARFLGLILKGEVEMDPADYRLEGTVGQVSVSIPRGGTGEVQFEKGGTRRGEAARALGGAAIPRGTEVVITSYVNGFATVQPWGEFLSTRDKLLAPAEQKES